MQLTTLNKLIRLFLIGSCALFVVLLAYWKEVGQFIHSGQMFGKAELAIPIGVFFITITALLGSILEGLADVTTCQLFKYSMTSRTVAKLFLKSKNYEILIEVRNRFISVVEKMEVYSEFSDLINTSANTFASGLFHNKGLQEHVKGVDTHYSMFILASSYCLILLLSLIALVGAFVADHMPVHFLVSSAILILPCAYLLGVFAIDNYLYSYEAIFRQALLWLVEHSQNSEKPDTLKVL